MAALYTLDEAQALLPEARRRVARVARLVADLQQLVARLEAGTAPVEVVDDVSGLEAEVEAAFRWFEDRSVQVKSLDPTLLDFPARAIRDGEPVEVLLCWRDDEDTVGYSPPTATGYRTREPVAFLDRCLTVVRATARATPTGG